MKKLILYTLLLSMIIIVSCKEKKTEPSQSKVNQLNYSIDLENTKSIKSMDIKDRFKKSIITHFF